MVRDLGRLESGGAAALVRRADRALAESAPWAGARSLARPDRPVRARAPRTAGEYTRAVARGAAAHERCGRGSARGGEGTDDDGDEARAEVVALDAIKARDLIYTDLRGFAGLEREPHVVAGTGFVVLESGGAPLEGLLRIGGGAVAVAVGAVEPAGGARRRRSRTRSTASWWRRYGIGRPNPGAVAGSAIPPSPSYHGRAERPSADRRVDGTGVRRAVRGAAT